MPIWILEIWECEGCGKLEQRLGDSSVFSDYYIGGEINQETWDISEKLGDDLLCPECLISRASEMLSEKQESGRTPES